MAELVIKIGDKPGGKLKDGDILCAFTDRRISQVHVAHMTHPRMESYNSDGLLPNDGLCKFAREKVYEYRFERISEKIVRRVALRKIGVKFFSDIPDINGHYIHVQQHIDNREELGHPCLFGTSGNEIWYGGKPDFSEVNLDAIWTEIESKTLYRKADYTLHPLGDMDVKVHYAVKLDTDITEARTFELTRPERDSITEKVVQKRINYVDWRALPGLSVVDKLQIENKSISVDDRGRFSFNESSIVSTRSLIGS